MNKYIIATMLACTVSTAMAAVNPKDALKMIEENRIAINNNTDWDHNQQKDINSLKQHAVSDKELQKVQTAINDDISRNRQQEMNHFNQMSNQMNDMQDDIDKLNDGVAMAFAMSAVPMAAAQHSTAVGVGMGTFNGSAAASVGASHKYENLTLTFKAATTSGDFGASAGIGYTF